MHTAEAPVAPATGASPVGPRPEVSSDRSRSRSTRWHGSQRCQIWHRIHRLRRLAGPAARSWALHHVPALCRTQKPENLGTTTGTASSVVLWDFAGILGKPHLSRALLPQGIVGYCLIVRDTPSLLQGVAGSNPVIPTVWAVGNAEHRTVENGDGHWLRASAHLLSCLGARTLSGRVRGGTGC